MTPDKETVSQVISMLLSRHPEYHQPIDAWIKQYRLQQAKQAKYMGLNELDKKLEKYLDFDHGYFVELGANDGLTQSNTFYFETHRNWRGVLIEPVLHNYFNCIANRASRTKVFCNACVSFDYQDTFVELLYSNLMSVPKVSNSDITEPTSHAELGQQFLKDGEHPVSFGARAASLNSLLNQADAPKTIDLLSLDVEGAEREVLAGIDHEAYRFRFICVESRNQSLLDQDLRRYRYQCIDQLSGHDYLYTNQ